MKKSFVALVAVLALVLTACTAAEEEAPAPTPAPAPVELSTLEEVTARGVLQCGTGSVPGFSAVDADGRDIGFDVDICRALAAVVLGNANAVEFQTGIPGADRLTLLVASNFDILSRTTTHKMSRDTTDNVEFLPTVFYDAQRMMGKKSLGITAASGFDAVEGGKICLATGTTTEVNIQDAGVQFGVSFDVVNTENRDQSVEQFTAGACDFFSTDSSALAGFKAAKDTEDDWVIFGPEITKEPLAPVVRSDDRQWYDIAKWTIYALFILDERGVTSQNADDMAANPPDAEIENLLAGDGSLQASLGLAPDAFLLMLKQVGNYGEIYARNLDPVGLVREGGLNAQWTEGGLIYAPVAK